MEEFDVAAGGIKRQQAPSDEGRFLFVLCFFSGKLANDRPNFQIQMNRCHGWYERHELRNTN
jgi:hypothetical protein